jgi:phosphate starvation-inducible protein PhoH
VVVLVRGDELEVGRATPELAPYLRALYDALAEARPYVKATCDDAWARGMIEEHDRAYNILERVDGALADAGEVLI